MPKGDSYRTDIEYESRLETVQPYTGQNSCYSPQQPSIKNKAPLPDHEDLKGVCCKIFPADRYEEEPRSEEATQDNDEGDIHDPARGAP